MFCFGKNQYNDKTKDWEVPRGAVFMNGAAEGLRKPFLFGSSPSPNTQQCFGENRAQLLG